MKREERKRDGEKEKSSGESETEERNSPLLESTTGSHWVLFSSWTFIGSSSTLHQRSRTQTDRRRTSRLPVVLFFFFLFLIVKPYQQESIEKLNILKISLKLLHRLVKQQSHNPKDQKNRKTTTNYKFTWMQTWSLRPFEGAQSMFYTLNINNVPKPSVFF